MALKFNPAAIKDRTRKAVMRGIIRGTEAVRNEAISLILNTPKTGRLYRRASVFHHASGPGEPPASDTGRLVNSIVTTYDATKLSGTVVAGTAYAPYLEYGTQTMEPRPFLRPALANKRAEVVTYISEELNREFKT